MAGKAAADVLSRQWSGRHEIRAFAHKLTDGGWEARSVVTVRRNRPAADYDVQIPIDSEPFDTEDAAVAHAIQCAVAWSKHNPL
jgi:hypothetical protein